MVKKIIEKIALSVCLVVVVPSLLYDVASHYLEGSKIYYLTTCVSFFAIYSVTFYYLVEWEQTEKKSNYTTLILGLLFCILLFSYLATFTQTDVSSIPPIHKIHFIAIPLYTYLIRVSMFIFKKPPPENIRN